MSRIDTAVFLAQVLRPATDVVSAMVVYIFAAEFNVSGASPNHEHLDIYRVKRIWSIKHY
jgi:hypothetical protein